MPDYSEALKQFRGSGYPKDQDAQKEPESSGVRTIKLTDDEAQELQGSSQEPGADYTCEVTGKLEGNVLRVMSVKSSGGGAMDMNADAQSVMSKAGSVPMRS